MATHTAIELSSLERSSHQLGAKSSHLPVMVPVSSEGRPLGSSDAVTAQIVDTTPAPTLLRKGRSYIIIAQVAGITFLTSFSNGLIAIGLPTIGPALSLHNDLLLWPNSAYYLVTGSCLLISGTLADVVGARRVFLAGCLIVSTFVLASGFAQTGIQLIMLRAMQGIGGALVVPSSVSIVSANVQAGTPRNIGFGCIGLSMPLGFSTGLVLGGVLISSVGWRAGYYIGGSICFLISLMSLWSLPAEIRHTDSPSVWKRLRTEIDWVGALLASAALALLSYVLAMLSADIASIKKASNIAALTISLLLFPSFVAWMQWREKHNKPALIPNSLWKKASFSTICVMVLLANATCDTMEVFCSLFYQEVQNTSALGASIRILPSLVVGACLQLSTGIFVNRAPVVYIVLISTFLSSGAPLLMAVINPDWPYWYDAFFAQLLSPFSADMLFTVGLLIVSESFPVRAQALAGAVFTTFAQLGISIGLTVMSTVASSVTSRTEYADKMSPKALMVGYRASFWAMFSWMIAASIVGFFGLRKLGKVGVKLD